MEIDLREIPVFVINLEDQEPLFSYVQERLHQRGFKNVSRILGTKHVRPYLGWALTYHHLLQSAKCPFIVLEDDADFYADALPILEVPSDADALYLGNSCWSVMAGHVGYYLRYKKIQGFENIVRIYNMLSAHAILYINEEFQEEAIRIFRHSIEEETIVADQGLAMIQRFWNVYSLNNPMFFQRPLPGRVSNTNGTTNKKIEDYISETPELLGSSYKWGYVFRDYIIRP